MSNENPAKVRPEDHYKPSEAAKKVIAEGYRGFYEAKDARDQVLVQFQNHTLQDVWTISRKLFWNSTITKSEDLEALGLDFSLPFVRKEVMDFVGRLTSMNVIPVLGGDGEGQHAMRFLEAMHRKWRLKSRDRVEKFWQILYGVINGTTCEYVGFDGSQREYKFMTSLSEDGTPVFKTEKKKLWNDVYTELVPIEEIYLSKIFERDIQKQGRTFRKQEMSLSQFKKEYPEALYPNAAYAHCGNMIAEDSLFFQLLNASGIIEKDKIQVLTIFDTDKDQKIVLANGVWINPLKGDIEAPNPFSHKMQPYVWSIHEAVDNNLAYGIPMPFKIKDTTKILNTATTMLVERELRAIDPPIISSDFEAPEIIFGQGKVINVNDVDAYKEFRIQEASGSFQNFLNSLQGQQSSFANGGFSQMAPSKQPRSAQEISQLEHLKQQTLGNALVMYYDMVHQELFLVLKTMLQFYAAEKWALSGDDTITRKFTVGDMPLSQGGVGNLDVRIVTETKPAIDLYFESVARSVQTGKKTEIIEASIDFILNLEFFVDSVKLEPEKSSQMERSLYVEQILTPMLQTFVPMGLADAGKTYLRYLEKMGEHPSDYTADGTLTGLMGGRAPAALPATGNQTGNMQQSQRGMMFGGQSSQPVPQDV